MNNGWLSYRQAATLVLVAATALACYVSFRIASPFVTSLVWALALSVVALPAHRKVEGVISNRTASAIVSVVLITVIIITPVVFAGQQIARQVANNAESVRQQIQTGAWSEWLQQYPPIASIVEQLELESNLRNFLEDFLARAPDLASSFLGGSIWMLTQLLVTLFLLFYFFRDREELLRSARGMIPLKGAEIDKVFDRIRDTIFATVYGRAVSAVLQGALGGLMFWWLGVPGPFLWGVVMAVLGLLPMVGSFIVWIPAAAYLGFSGSWVKSFILIGWGIAVVSVVDDVLYPILVGDRLRMHTVPVFISIFGGVLIFGAVGIVLGPVMFTLLTALLDIWKGHINGNAE